MFLVGDETKHVVWFIFHALCMCLTVENFTKDGKEEEEMDPV